jgi:hypothetical protein
MHVNPYGQFLKTPELYHVLPPEALMYSYLYGVNDLQGILWLICAVHFLGCLATSPFLPLLLPHLFLKQGCLTPTTGYIDEIWNVWALIDYSDFVLPS